MKVKRHKTKTAKVAENTAKSAAPLDRKRERRELRLAELHAAPWNARPDITPESVADLVKSISTLGLIQPIVVTERGDGEYLIIAGHRRAAACREAGFEAVPCDVMINVTEADARRMTFIENLQRADVDPLMESDLVAQLLADGMTQAEIVAETGRGERWVARRANLRSLSKEWREAAAKYKITVDALERVAAYPADIQKSAYKDCGFYGDELCGWNDIKYIFNRHSCNLNDVPFGRTVCTNCPKNSACAPLLFADEGDGQAKYGQCLDSKCYAKRWNEAVERIIAKAKADGATVRKVKEKWDVPVYWNVAKKRDDTHCVLYTWNKTGLPEYCWGAKGKESESDKGNVTSAAATADERRAKREENKAIRAVAEWCARDSNLANSLLSAMWNDEVSYMVAVQYAFSGLSSYNFAGCTPSIHDILRAKLLDCSGCMCHTVEENMAWARATADEIIRQMGPTRYCAIYNAQLVLAMFASARDDLPGVAIKLLPPSVRDKMRNIKIVQRDNNEEPDDDDCLDEAEIGGEG